MKACEKSTVYGTFLQWRWSQAAVTVDAVSVNVFHYTHRVTYADCTLGNHIYYARYLDLLEAARGGFFRQLGLPLLQLQEQDTVFPVVECRLRYKSPARYDDVLTIEVWPTLAEGVRLNFGYRLLKEKNVLVFEGETLHVCAGVNEKPKRLPADLIAKLERLVTPVVPR